MSKHSGVGGMPGDFTAASIALKHLERSHSSKVFPGQSRVWCEGLRYNLQQRVALDLTVKHLVNKEPLDYDQSQLPDTTI